MPLKVCATSLGHPKDITVHVLDAIREAEIVIGEEAKPTRQLLKTYELTGRLVEECNEHSNRDDILHLVELCKNKNVVLVSDCGTPGFCDPGADLVKACREAQVPVQGLPGPSSLMVFLSVCGRRVDRFLFDGFLPRESSDRRRRLRSYPKDTPVLLLETPYRLQALMSDLEAANLERSIVLALDLTLPTEAFFEGTIKFVKSSVEKQFGDRHKAEIVLMLE
jgi:16S rRNA (cytidine1402-2'-O)-methyltransferase